MRIQAACSLILREDGRVLSVSRKGSLGDFGLPGGKCELSDADPLDTAIRETLEETGVRLEREHMRQLYAGPALLISDSAVCVTYLAERYDDTEMHAVEPDTIVAWVERSALVDSSSSFCYYNRKLFEVLE